MSKRSENDIALGRGIEVTLGGERHTILPPPIAQEDAWREKLAEILTEASGWLGELDTSSSGAATSSAFRVLMPRALVKGPRWMREVVYAYCPELLDEGVDEVTAAEAVAAFRAILELERPFFIECWRLFGDLKELTTDPSASGETNGSKSRK